MALTLSPVSLLEEAEILERVAWELQERIRRSRGKPGVTEGNRRLWMQESMTAYREAARLRNMAELLL